MISERAKSGFEQLLKDALAENLVLSSAESCVIQPLPDASAIQEKEFVVLTISSYLFRLIALSYFTPNADTKARFAELNKTSLENLSNSAFYDAVAEYGNRFCGTLNRSVGRYFPHVGMSTPNILDRGCGSYLTTLGARHIRHFQVALGETSVYHATLAICDYGNLDFQLEVGTADATGELELF